VLGDFVAFTLPVSVACALAIAAAGHFIGTRSAKWTAVALWVMISVAQQIVIYQSHAPWRSGLLSALVVALSLSIIIFPMLSLPSFNWARGRLAGGLAGAVVAAFVHFPFVLILGCVMGIDCL
jgi:hypothetical protein